MSCPVAPELGAYVLGALPPDERRQVEEHAAGCPSCAAELAELGVLPALLDRVTPEDLQPVAVASSPELFDRVVAAAAVRPDPRRRRLLLAAAAAVLVLLGAGGVVWAQQGGPETYSASAGSVQLTVTPVEAGNGSALDVTVAGLSSGQTCRLVAVDRDGERHPAGEWVVSYEGEGRFRGWTDLEPDDLAAVVLLGEGGEELVRVWT